MPILSASIVLHGPASIDTSGGGPSLSGPASIGGPLGHIDPIVSPEQAHQPLLRQPQSQPCSQVSIWHDAPG
jgi:hypothetical protein